MLLAAWHLPLTTVSPDLHLAGAATCFFCTAGAGAGLAVGAGVAANAEPAIRPRASAVRLERMFMGILLGGGKSRMATETGEPIRDEGAVRSVETACASRVRGKLSAG